MLESSLCIEVILRILDKMEAVNTELYFPSTEISMLEKINLGVGHELLVHVQLVGTCCNCHVVAPL